MKTDGHNSFIGTVSRAEQNPISNGCGYGTESNPVWLDEPAATGSSFSSSHLLVARCQQWYVGFEETVGVIFSLESYVPEKTCVSSVATCRNVLRGIVRVFSSSRCHCYACLSPFVSLFISLNTI
jgi:hypothetical protein